MLSTFIFENLLDVEYKENLVVVLNPFFKLFLVHALVVLLNTRKSN